MAKAGQHQSDPVQTGQLHATGLAGDMITIQICLRYALWAFESMMLPPFCILFPLAVVSFFPAAIIVGTLYPATTNPTIRHDINRSAMAFLDALAYGSLASSASWVWRMKGFRWYAASLMIMIECLTWGALFIAGMSLTGDWL